MKRYPFVLLIILAISSLLPIWSSDGGCPPDDPPADDGSEGIAVLPIVDLPVIPAPPIADASDSSK